MLEIFLQDGVFSYWEKIIFIFKNPMFVSIVISVFLGIFLPIYFSEKNKGRRVTFKKIFLDKVFVIGFPLIFLFSFFFFLACIQLTKLGVI